MADVADIANDTWDMRTQTAIKSLVAQNSQSTEGQDECEECGNEIPKKRRQALPTVATCVDCQEAIEKHRSNFR